MSDTERLNRFIGSSPVDYQPLAQASSAARYLLRAQVGPSMVDYEEEPYEWDEARRFSFRRVMRNGLVAALAAEYLLADAPGGGTLFTATLKVTPRFLVVWPATWLVSRGIYQRILAFARACDEAAIEKRDVPLASSPADRGAAEKAASGLRKRHDPALVDRLVEFLCTAGDVAVRRIRPFELADDWQRGRQELLRLCLDGVRAGLTDLHWSLICPSCRGPSESLPSLAELEATSHCQFCEIAFDVDLDRAVEATFSPHATLRRIDLRPYCIGGPRLKPHVVSQALFAPGVAAKLRAADVPGRYRLFVQGGATSLVDVGESGPAQVSVPARLPAQIEVAAGGEISVTAPEAPGHAKLERVEWEFNAATAVLVSSLPEFRAQFGSAALRPGLVLKVGRVAILFSDLVGSTALYSRLGDAAAFGIVTDCLEYGRGIVERHGGTVVKTMGDAIMAVFAEPANAVEAAAETVRGWAAFQAAKPAAVALDVKLGVAAGPCTIVTANGVLDYFGQTVNTAARVQHLASGRQIVLTTELAGTVPAGVSVAERFEAKVKGIDEPLKLARLVLGG
ncbi:MAG: adenylate/guanylate cyclase domain-containing protein [Myxococcaceae bacterium]|nr:adenylate/guanylate cyclase domain-containing protein [Myxococcaceae bacterium]